MKRAGILALAVGAAWMAGCSDDGTAPTEGEATILGRVEAEVAPAGAQAPAAAAATALAARTVIVAEVQADGSLASVAEADVEADGSFTVEGVAAGLEDLVVVARDESEAAVGRALVHARTTADATIEVAPIDVGTTLEGRAFSEVRANGGDASSGEVSLYLHASSGTSADVVGEAEVAAGAAGVLAVEATLTEAFDATGAALDASARAESLNQAAMEFAAARYGGTGAAAAEGAFLDAAVEAMVDAGVTPDAVVQATAAAATTMDLTLDGASSHRAELAREAVRLNLRARQHAAEALTSGAEASVASNLLGVLGTVESSVTAAATPLEIQAALSAGTTAALGTMLEAVVDLLVFGADVLLIAEVEDLALTAAQSARLSVRLAGAGTPANAGAALASYRTEVRAAVQTMVETSGNTDVDVDAMTSLFVAAFGGAAIH